MKYCKKFVDLTWNYFFIVNLLMSATDLKYWVSMKSLCLSFLKNCLEVAVYERCCSSTLEKVKGMNGFMKVATLLSAFLSWYILTGVILISCAMSK